LLAATASFSATEPPACLHPIGENATQPIEQRYGTLVALLLGISPLRRRALPAQASQPSFASNCRIQVQKAGCTLLANLAGGMLRWRAEAMPVEQESD
jgi:hypothetical protein